MVMDATVGEPQLGRCVGWFSSEDLLKKRDGQLFFVSRFYIDLSELQKVGN
jgi:hypothetical protein